MLTTLKRGLVAAGLAGAILVLPATTAFAGTTAGQGAQKSPLTANPSVPTCNGPTGGTVTANSFATNVLDRTTGDVTTTVHLQNATPNYTYDVDVFINVAGSLGGCGGTNQVTLTTNGQGNGTVSFITSFPTATNALVAIFSADINDNTVYFESNSVPLS
jgi:hypothetical protein